MSNSHTPTHTQAKDTYMTQAVCFYDTCKSAMVTMTVAAIVALHRTHADIVAAETTRPVMSDWERQCMTRDADELSALLPTLWAQRRDNKFAYNVCKQAIARYVELETTLGDIDPHPAMVESFYLRCAPWAPDEGRIEGDTDILVQCRDEWEKDAQALRFRLHAARRSTCNRVELSKAKLVPFFSWGKAWADTKVTMRTIGAELRQCEQSAKEYDTEIRRREYDALTGREDTYTMYSTSGHAGATECDADYDIPVRGPHTGWATWEMLARPTTTYTYPQGVLVEHNGILVGQTRTVTPIVIHEGALSTSPDNYIHGRFSDSPCTPVYADDRHHDTMSFAGAHVGSNPLFPALAPSVCKPARDSEGVGVKPTPTHKVRKCGVCRTPGHTRRNCPTL